MKMTLLLIAGFFSIIPNFGLRANSIETTTEELQEILANSIPQKNNTIRVFTPLGDHTVSDRLERYGQVFDLSKAEDHVWSKDRRKQRYCFVGAIHATELIRNFGIANDDENRGRTLFILDNLHVECMKESTDFDVISVLTKQLNLMTGIQNKKYALMPVKFPKDLVDYILSISPQKHSEQPPQGKKKFLILKGGGSNLR
jgi:hypothetical protein